MNITNFLQQIQGLKNEEKKTALDSLANDKYKSRQEEINKRLREINTAYIKSSQDAWKYKVN